MHLKTSSAKMRPFCSGWDDFTHRIPDKTLCISYVITLLRRYFYQCMFQHLTKIASFNKETRGMQATVKQSSDVTKPERDTFKQTS